MVIFFFFFFLNVEFLCVTLSNFVKKIICQTLRRRANLEQTDLIRQTTYQFSICDSFDTCFGVSIRRTMVIHRVVCLTAIGNGVFMFFVYGTIHQLLWSKIDLFLQIQKVSASKIIF